MIRRTRPQPFSAAAHPIWQGMLATALAALGLLTQHLVSPRLAAQADPAVLMLSASAAPASVYTSDEVTYLITLENNASLRAEGVSIEHTLPPGFAYVAGSTELAANLVVVARSEPQISGNTLRWSDLSAPAARASGVWGMHTFVQDRCERAYIGGQLDHVRRLMGPNAYVKQLFYRITIETQGPESCWVEFVNGCYDRDLIPVVRLAGPYGGPNWIKPPASAPGDYAQIAQAFARVVAGLPRREDRPLYVEIWNEPNLDIEWGGAANPTEYAHFLVDVAQAIRALGDTRIRLLNGGLSPGGNYERLAFIDAMAQVPGAMQAFDVWAAHPYPGNHPPEYNIHDNNAPLYPELTIDSYLLELARLAAHGRKDVQVLLSETGYALGQNNFGFQGYAPIDEGNRADYIARALRNYWSHWPEVLGVCPFELVDPYGGWEVWDWLYPSGARHLQYDAVLGLDKSPILAEGDLRVRFRARAAASPGVYASEIRADSANAGTAALTGVAPVTVKARPVTLTPTPTATPKGSPTPTPTPSPTPICYPALINGGFETDAAWLIPNTAYPAGYSEAVVRSGRRSLRLGIVSDPPILSYSSANQPFYVPAAASSARIRFWYYTVSEDTAHGRQYALLLDENREYLETILWTAEDAAAWQWREHEVFGYAGQTLYLHFGVQNDGEGSPSAMYVDDVEVQVCGPESMVTPTSQPSPSLTPTATPTTTPTPSSTATASPTATSSASPTATATASPTATPSASPTATATPPATHTPTATASPTPTLPSPCEERIANGGFEAQDGWRILNTALPARYASDRAKSGAWSMLLGIADPAANAYSYSSVEQTLTLPQEPSISLSFWYYPLSSDPSNDRQYVLVLDGQGGVRTLMWSVSDAQTWSLRSYDLSAYAGTEITVRFGVFNDGEDGATAMYLDDVSLKACSQAPEPTQTPRPEPTPTPQPVTPQVEPTMEPPSLPVYLERTVPVGRAPYGVAVDAFTGLVYVANYLGGDVSIVDPLVGQTIDAIPLEGASGAYGIAIDSERGRGFVASSLSHELVGFDLVARQIIGRLDLPQAPRNIAIDRRDGSVYVANYDAGSVSVVDGHFMIETATLTVGTEPADLLVDPEQGRLIVANHHPLFNSLGVYALDSLEAGATVPVGAGPNDLAMDALSGRIVTANMVGRSLSLLSAQIEFERDIALPHPVYLAAINPRTGRIFAVCPDVQSVYVLDGSSGETLLTLPIGQGAGRGIALDWRSPAASAGALVYITNTDDDTLTVLRDGNGLPRITLPLILREAHEGGLAGLQPLAERSDVSPASLDPALPERPLGLAALPAPLQAQQRDAEVRALALDNTRRRLSVARGELVMQLDALTGRPLSSWNLEGDVSALAADPLSGASLAAVGEAGTLHRLAPGGDVSCTASGLGRVTYLLAYQGRVYASDAAGQRLVVIDAESCGIIASKGLQAAPDGLAIDAERRLLFVGLAGPGAIVALDLDTWDVRGQASLEGLGYPLQLAHDATTHTLYIAHALSPKYGALSAMDTTDVRDLTLLTSLWGYPEQPLWGVTNIAVIPERQAVILGLADGALALDCKTLAVLDHVMTPGSPWANTLLVDPSASTVYLAGVDGRIWSWREPSLDR